MKIGCSFEHILGELFAKFRDTLHNVFMFMCDHNYLKCHYKLYNHAVSHKTSLKSINFHIIAPTASSQVCIDIRYIL